MAGSYWGTGETKCLVESWKETMVQNNINEIPVSRNSYLYMQVCEKMKKNGYSNKTWKQCGTKIKGLITRYRKVTNK